MGRTGRKRDGKVVVLLAEIREEKNWEKAKESYRDVQQAIIDGSTVELFNDAARMIPEGIKPECIEKQLEIEPYDREVHGDLTGKRLRTKAEGSSSTKKRKRDTDVTRNVPEGALLGFVSAATLTVRKKGTKKKPSTPRADGLDSDDDAIEAGVFPVSKPALESDEETPVRKRVAKAKTTSTTKATKPRKSAIAIEEGSPEPPTLSQPQLASSPRKAKKTKASAVATTSSNRSFSTSSRAKAETGPEETLLLASSSSPASKPPPPFIPPTRPKPFPLSRKSVAPPSSPFKPPSSTKPGPSNEIKPTTISGVKRDLSWLLHSDSDIEILKSTPPRASSPNPIVDGVKGPNPSTPIRIRDVNPLTFVSPASPKLEPPTDSPDRSFPVRRAGRPARMAILDSSPLGSPSDSQAGADSGQPSTPPRRRIRRGRPPSPIFSAEAETRTKVTNKGKGKAKSSILEKHRFLETEAQFSGSEEDEDADFDPEGVENEYDREFVRDSPLTQAPAGYNQQQYYAMSLMTQVPGDGPRFASGPTRYTDYLGKGGAWTEAILGNRRREGVSSSPVREGVPASQYAHDSFVVGDDEEIEYEDSSDID